MNPFMSPEQFPMTMNTTVVNPPNRPPVTIVSGEYDDLNGKVLQPGQQMKISIIIPPGYREYICEQRICGKDIMYVGLRDAAQPEPFFHTPNFKY